tara:strand:+ start:17620 stop:19503 length:1884 start_codon:yes stop_codon:yes gene_type:complete
MSILNTKVSWFKSTKQTDVQPAFSISSFINLIKNGKYKEQIDKVRAGDKSVKTQLPTIAFHGIFEYSRKAANFIEASGLIILDIDNIGLDGLEEMKQEIMDSSDSVFATMISPSGNGIKVLYYVEPDSINKDNYRAIGKEVISQFSDYGDVDFLSITDTLIMTHDPNILINEDAFPDVIKIKEVEVKNLELEPRDASKNLWEDAEEFFEVVLDQQIIQRVTSNFHYIQVSMLELAKFGFYHPESDLSFVVHYSEEHFKISKDNRQRFIDASELAKTHQQTRWAYDTRAVKEASVEIDYSAFQDDEVGMTVYDDEIEDEDEISDSNELSETGVIDYSKLYKSVVETILEGDRVGREISLSNFADVFRFRGTGILTVTGIPGHGKTEWVDQLLVDLARLYNESSLIVGFEQTPEEHVIKLSRKMIGSNITCSTWWNKKNEIVFKENYNFITKKIQHIDVKKVGGKIENILIKSAEWIQQQRKLGEDPKYVVIDPFNMLSTTGKVSGYEKAEEILRQLTHFSHQMGVLVILVAHPFKMKKDEKTGEYEIPDFYSVKGSSAFFEMSYHGLTIYRTNGMVLVRVLKVKQNNLGDAGADVWFMYDRNSGRYIPCDEDGGELSGDHRDKNWLKK